MMQKLTFQDIYKIPNLISLFRVFFIYLLIYFFKDVENFRWQLILTLILFSLLDNLDGYFARKLNQITELGKIIDPLVDKLFIIIGAYLSYHHNIIPIWFMLLVIIRDLTILLFGLFFIRKKDFVPASDLIGKMTVGSIGVVFIYGLLGFNKSHFLFNLILIISSTLILLSLINYGMKNFGKIR